VRLTAAVHAVVHAPLRPAWAGHSQPLRPQSELRAEFVVWPGCLPVCMLLLAVVCVLCVKLSAACGLVVAAALLPLASVLAFKSDRVCSDCRQQTG
jgi:hypothetical protein